MRTGVLQRFKPFKCELTQNSQQILHTRGQQLQSQHKPAHNGPRCRHHNVMRQTYTGVLQWFVERKGAPLNPKPLLVLLSSVHGKSLGSLGAVIAKGTNVQGCSEC